MQWHYDGTRREPENAIPALNAHPEVLEGGESLHPTPKTTSQKNASKIKSEKAGKEDKSAAAAGTF